MQIIKRKVYFKFNYSFKEKFSNFFHFLRINISIVLRKKAAINTNIFKKKL
jgi:hypothetical protein